MPISTQSIPYLLLNAIDFRALKQQKVDPATSPDPARKVAAPT